MPAAWLKLTAVHGEQIQAKTDTAVGVVRQGITKTARLTSVCPLLSSYSPIIRFLKGLSKLYYVIFNFYFYQGLFYFYLALSCP